ncbi:UDP-3-O-(3-hydroxymyristoyl)glucosamine N-acyltransferase [Pseudobacteriovorax antillogorgiicola]|uniref:UDP-3-O-acylglucosamine N-acyltransferase n=1 Tax=Pseudobacteriovorax antillogorgiicola TaxID=1513793 RepID=A0A1Y6CD44_9BACT|nr:UDP-3-O-(3-hydroxymyristoyl)glucosamine N-acyltransferase [Pseudobacteriovorax antillogorgiicola]TCS48647.1 UDP-3-O-[3-hydroxymyristoyl] glucosamine N-acyltransferase [Pseudobacteriovorax antillogorgiicola]SMF55247.1 UDP-3-O-[3-hydroxymyristoyl] glucosamine N-acyltransferase [Pseudobacteriovorax antillogorgiicola]
MKLIEIASHIKATIKNQMIADDFEVLDIKALEFAGEQDISFLTNTKYLKYLKNTKACAVILAKEDPSLPLTQLIHPNPYAAMAIVSQAYYQRSHSYDQQSSMAFVHPTAKVDESATLYPFTYIDQGATIGAEAVIYPGAFVGKDAYVGDRTILYPGAVVLEECRLGKDCILHPNAVIGGDGFGFAPTGGPLEKIPQIGKVVIGDDVEIGSTSTVDRGAFEDTTIDNGTKLDSQVHIAHGVKLGKYGMLCGQTEIAGSTKVGDNIIMAGQSAIGPSLEVGSHITLGPRAGLTNSHSKSGTYMGMPISPIKDWRRQAVGFKQLPDVLSRLRKMEAELEELKAEREIRNRRSAREAKDITSDF